MRLRGILIAVAATAATALWLVWPDAEADSTQARGPHEVAVEVSPAPPEATAPQRAPLPAAASASGATTSGIVHGRVLDALGQPVADAAVTLVAARREDAFATAEPPPPLAATASGTDGRFALELRERAEVLVTVSHRDFPPRVVEHGLEVAPGTKASVGDVVLVSEPGLIVLVGSANGGGIRDAVVTASPAVQEVSLPTAIGGLARRVAVTDAAGRAVLYGLAAGAYLVHVEAPSWATQEVRHLQPHKPPQAPTLPITLQPGHAIRGRVQPPPGADPGRVQLTAEPVDGGVVLRDQARANGEFRIAGASVGAYRVWAEPTRLNRSMVTTVVPSPGPITIPLGADLSLRGTVRDAESGVALSSALVVAEPENGWPLARGGDVVRPDAAADQDGIFHIIGLPPGRDVLTVSSEGFVPTRLGPVEAGADRIEIRLERGLAVQGRVLADGLPVSGARVRAIPWQDESSAFALWRSALGGGHGVPETTTDGAGAFALPGIAVRGRRLVIEAPGCALWTSPPLLGRAGGSLDLGTIALTRGAAIEGTAEPHATVCLQTPDGSGFTHTTTADGKGRFEFSGLPAGDYVLFYHSAARSQRGASAPPSVKKPVTLRQGDRIPVALND
jgi:hypothetical protein